jgi:hypothetical protein
MYLFYTVFSSAKRNETIELPNMTEPLQAVALFLFKAVI